MAKRAVCTLLLLFCGAWTFLGSAKADRAVSRRLLTGDSAQAFTGLSGRKLAQSSTLAQGLYHIQSVSRLETCWNYLSIPNCTVGDTVDLYYEDDGSGRQQFDIVPLSGSNLYYLEINNGRSGCASWLSGQPCPENRIGAAYSDDTSGRQQWYLNSLGNDTYTVSLPRGREKCDTFLSASCCGANSTSFVTADTGSGAEHWLITPISNSNPSPPPPPPAALESQVFAASTESATSGSSSASSSPSPPPPPPSSASTESPPPPPPPSSSSGTPPPPPPPTSGATTESASEPPPPPPPTSTTESPPPMAEQSPPPPSGVSTVSQFATSASSPPPPPEETPVATSAATVASTSGCSGKKGVVYDYFFQYCDSVLVTNSDWYLNFDAATACTDASVIAKYQPMIWGTDRIQSGYASITALPSPPAYVLTFNEPNYAFGGGTTIPTNVVDPVTAAGLWPTLMAQYDPLGIGLIAPSAITCAGDPNCYNTGTQVGWLSLFRDTLNANTPGAWDAIHALNHHTYVTDFATIQSDLTSLYQEFGKPIWVTEIASGSGSSMEQNVALMNQFVPWANSQSWIERYFWNQATPAEGTDANIQNSYLVNKDANGSGDGSLSVLGQTYADFPC